MACHIPPLEKAEKQVAITIPSPVPSLNRTFLNWVGRRRDNGISPCFFAFSMDGL